ncbi:non-ribosomal peptide synthetase [Lentzea atacamensis]|uniref:non-ribosomal peptide synthetase n=1 Tax=Lentzea atacamensis TaxID=531938 RepID=UPI0014733332|nr:non-ribosomal peptide synthetase [Lentzea atacamensis]
MLVAVVDEANLDAEPVRREHLEQLSHVVASTEATLLIDNGVLRCDADADLLDEPTVGRLLTQVVTILRAEPTTPVFELDLVDAEELALLLSFSAATPPSTQPLIHDLIDQRAKERPDAIAVTFEGRSLTYRDLERQSNAVAQELRRSGAGAGTRVGVRVERSLELVVALVGVLKSGAAYVPLDPHIPQARQAQIAELAGLTTLVTVKDLEPLEGLDELDVVLVMGEESDPLPGPRVDGDLPAYVLFTSGSTGTPKGVVVTHANVVRLFESCREQFGFSTSDVWLNAHTFAFDVSVWEIFGALTNGARLVVPSRDDTRDPEAMVELVRAQHVTILTTTPTAFHGVSEAVLALPDPNPVPSLRFVVFCGESLAPASLEPWFRRFAENMPYMINMYGITEATVHSTFYAIQPRDVRDKRRKVGRGLSDTPIRVLDRRGCLVPVGVVGEIHVGGAGVAAGYLVASQEDHTRFRPDKHSDVPGARLYRSGDLGRWLPDGNLEYLGRLDHQVKIRGYRVELGEIDQVLLGHPDVRAARTWLVHRAASPVLAAAVVLVEGVATQGELKDFLAARLPEYMVPAAFAVLAELPLTANGKLDQPCLPDPFVTEAESVMRVHEVDPRARKIAECMAQVLGLDTIATDTSFFERGGDSITAVRLVSALRRIGFDAGLPQVYQARTADALAEVLGAGHEAETTPAEPFARLSELDRSLLPDTAVDAFPATRLQAGMLFHNTLEGEHLYHDVFSYTFDGPLDEERFRAAVSAVVEDHPVLRSSFLVEEPETPLQIVHKSAEIFCSIVDVEPHERESEVERWAGAERATSFDWRTPGLLRVAVHRTRHAGTTLSLSFHHAILDGWSVASLVSDLLLRHANVTQSHGTAARDTRLLSYYAFLERDVEQAETHQKFWREQLDGVQATRLPFLGTDSSARGDEITVDLPRELTQMVRDLAQRVGVPVKTVYLAVHCALMSYVGGQPDILSGLVTGGRVEDDGGDEVLGLFLNTVPFRLNVLADNWWGLLRRVFDTEAAVYEHRRFPLARLQNDAAVGKLCPTAFNYTDFHVYRSLSEAGLVLRDIRYREKTDFELLVSVAEDPFTDATKAIFSYGPAVGSEQAGRCATLFLHLLRQAVERPDHQAALPDVRHVRGPDREHPSTVMSMIRDRMANAPDALAQCHGTQANTYDEVQRRAGAVAWSLRAAGVRPADRVACYLERGLDPLVALIGVWAAGASYVPIDPSLPLARQQKLLDIAGCTAVVRSSGIDPDGVLGEAPQIVLDGTLSAEEEEWASPLPDDEAYVLFTSGSTGTPKAVSMPHSAMGNLISWQIRQPEFDGPVRVAQFASLSFDVSVQEMLAAVASGGTLVVVPESARRNPQELLDILSRDGVTLAFLPVVALHQLAAAQQAFGTTPTALRHVITAGEALVITDDVRAFATAAGVEVVNQYGPTETHVTTCHRLGARPEQWPDEPPIGRPIDNTVVRVLDSAGRPVPPGTVGELHLGGANVATGYVPTGAEDSGKFRVEDGVRWYRTGDLVRCSDEQALHFAGRVDDQMKIRGHRVEPGEVAAVLLRHPAVRACVVKAVGMRDGLNLVAYVESNGATASEVVQHAQQHLPAYAVPAHIEFLERMPMTSSGKIDHLRLPEPTVHSAVDGEGPRAEETEARVLSVWEDLLGRAVVSPNLSFFEAGGNSLVLLQLYLRLRSAFDHDFAMHELFRYPTARAFAEFLDGHRHAVEPAEIAARAPSTRIADAATRRRAARQNTRNRNG